MTYKKQKNYEETSEIKNLNENLYEFKPIVDNSIGGSLLYITEVLKGGGPHVLKSSPDLIPLAAAVGAVAGFAYTFPGLLMSYPIMKKIMKRIGKKYARDFVHNVGAFMTSYVLYVSLCLLSGVGAKPSISEFLYLLPIAILGQPLRTLVEKVKSYKK